MDLTGVGLYAIPLRWGDPVEAVDAAAELDELGFKALWIPDHGGAVFDAINRLLSATKRTVIATGVLNLWRHDPADVALKFAATVAEHGERVLLGIGVSHAKMINANEPGRYRKPLAATRAFLDALDAAKEPVPIGSRVLAALGPKMLELAATRARGAHPYLVTPDHTRYARECLGKDALLLPEQMALLTDDESEAREIGTTQLREYLSLPNYANNLLRCGFNHDDVASISDRLFNALIVWGDEATVLRRVNEHFAAGADHVCVQVLTADLKAFPREQWRRLAAALC